MNEPIKQAPKLRWVRPGKAISSKDSREHQFMVDMVNRQEHERIHLAAHLHAICVARRIVSRWKDRHPEQDGDFGYCVGPGTHNCVHINLRLRSSDHIQDVFESGCADEILDDESWVYDSTNTPEQYLDAIGWYFKRPQDTVLDTSGHNELNIKITPKILLRCWFRKSTHCQMKPSGKTKDIMQLCCD